MLRLANDVSVMIITLLESNEMYNIFFIEKKSLKIIVIFQFS